MVSNLEADMKDCIPRIVGSVVLAALYVLLTVAVLFPSNALAAYSEAEVEQLAQEISETTMSPFCPGRTLSACPSGQARELRLKVITWLNEGSTPDEVRTQLLALYGDEVRGTPRTEGFGIMAWLVPAFVIMLTFLLILYALRNLKAQRGGSLENTAVEGVVSQGAESQESDPELLRRVQEEVEKRMQ